MRTLFTKFVLAASLLLIFPAVLTAQTSATVTGVVTDSSGAILPGAEVMLSNPSTGVEYKDTTNSAGSYHFGDVPPGPHYVMTFSHAGFATYSVKDVYVNVANSRTQNAKLTAGTSETIEVSAAGEGVTINTEDATIGNNFQVEQVNDLPIQNRNSPAILFSFQPGVENGSVTGARTDQSNVTVDGLDVNDFATGSFGSIIGNAPVDSIQELRGTTAGFGTSSGQGGGGQFQLVTKSGTNHFHGNLAEYHRDNSTTANTWFNKNTIPVTPLAKLVRNQFGGSIGGPVKHDKLFFFFNYDADRQAAQASASRTVPTDLYKNGTVTYNTDYQYDPTTGKYPCDGARLNDPTKSSSCFGTLTPAQIKALDPAGIGASPALTALLKSYPTANDLTGGDGLNTAAYRFVANNGSNLSVYTGKIDYNLSSKIKLWGVGNFTRQNSINGVQQFPGAAPAGQYVDRSYRYAGGMDWQISQNKFNRLSYGTTVADLTFSRAPNSLGVNQISFSSGTTSLLTTPFSSPVNAQGRHVPIPVVSDDFQWTVGRHNLEVGGFFKWINTSEFTNLDYLSDSIGLGGEVQGFTSALHPSNFDNGATGTVNFDEAFAVLLGRVGSTTGTFNYDKSGKSLPLASGSQRAYRYYNTETYVGDTWKVKPNLTLTYGLNWQIYSVPWERNGLETVQTTKFSDYIAARVKQSQAGNIAANSVPFFSYLLGGPVNNGPGYYNMSWKDLAPRLGLAFQPAPKTTFNAGANIVYDRTVVSAVQYQQDQYSYLFGQPVNQNYGDGSNPDADLGTPGPNGPYRYDHPPTAVAPPTPKAPFVPYVDGNGIPNGLINSAFNEMVSPDLRTPYSIGLNFGLQHEFPNSIIFKASYAGRFGRRLLAQSDTSQLIDINLGGQSMGTAIANVETQLRAGVLPANLTPQPYLETAYAAYGRSRYNSVTGHVANALGSLLKKGDFADTVQALDAAGLAAGYNMGMAEQLSENTMYTNQGSSTYHGLLVTLQQNLKHGLKYDLNYTWSHSIDNTSLIANGVAYGGYGFICDVLRPRLCRGNSDFDTTHVITSDYLYSLPVGRGRAFGTSMPLWLNEVIGGWDTSGVISWQSGQAFGTSSSAFVAGYSNNAPGVFNGNTAAIQRQVHKTSGRTVNLFANNAAAVAAFTPPTGFSIGSRNDLRGPTFFNWDAGLTKALAVWPDKGINLKLRADAFNVLNHPSFNSPGNNTNYDDVSQTGNFGQLTSTSSVARVVQLILRLEF